ncbi:adenosylhomocysteinase [Providencia stuartii]|nr:adenosylhomocysteinase [Providencia stuartii]
MVVAGYGWCGKGCAMRAKGLGAEVIITEIDPIKALEAKMDGFEVMTMEAAAPLGDIFVTATGCCDVLTEVHFSLMKEGAIISNTGHFEDEINLNALQELCVSTYEARQNIEAYCLKNGRTVYLLGRGALVNIACADGHPAEIMDMSFALQALGAEYLLKHALDKKVYAVSDEIDSEVARLKLQDMGVSFDTLSDRQYQYLNAFELK